MTADNNAEDPADRSGELIRRGEPPAPVPARTGTIGWLLSRLSRWPFRNRLYVNSLKTAKEVVEARNELGETYIKHEEIMDKVHDLPRTLAQRRMERLREYVAEERRLTTEVNDFRLDLKTMDQKNKIKKREINIQDMESQIREQQVKKQLEELKNPPAPPPEPEEEPTGRGPSEKQKLRERAHAKRDREIKRIEKLKRATPETKEALKITAENELEEELRKIDEMP